MKHAVIYARVSTDEQAEKGYSLPSQLDACRKYAEQHSLIIVNEFSEDYTGTKLDRPQFSKLRRLVQEHTIQAVIVFSSDRFTRSLAHKLILREEFQKNDVELHYVKRGKSEDTPESRMLENIEGVFDEYWREKIVESSQRGLHSKAKRGLIVGGGGPTYGYRIEDNSFVINEKQAQIVKDIFDWYVNEGLRAWTIARKLNEALIPPPCKSNNSRRHKRSVVVWHETAVLSILKNETYSGIWYYGKRIGTNGSHGTRPKSEWIAIPVPAIIHPSVWQRAQEIREVNKQMSIRNCKRAYLLRGMLFCGNCGRRLVGAFKRKTKIGETSYYHCTSRHDQKNVLEPGCRQLGLRVSETDEAVWQCILDLLAGDTFEDSLHEARNQDLARIETKRQALSNAESLIKQYAEKMEEYVELLAQAKTALLRQTINEKISSLENSYKALTLERDKLLSEVTAQSLSQEDIAAALEFRSNVIEGLRSATFEDKRRMLELLQVKIVVNDRRLILECRIPTFTGSIDLDTPMKCATTRNSLIMPCAT